MDSYVELFKYEAIHGAKNFKNNLIYKGQGGY